MSHDSDWKAVRNACEYNTENNWNPLRPFKPGSFKSVLKQLKQQQMEVSKQAMQERRVNI